jgi:hypothetical protein
VRKRSDKVFRVCEVRTKDFVSVGALFMETTTHIVLLNNVREGLDLGPVRPVRAQHMDPEADVWVIPAAIVEAVHFLDEAP